MSSVTFKGTKTALSGRIPVKGEKAPEFTLAKGDLSDAKLADFAGSRVVLNIFPSIDTPVCAAAVRRFNKIAGEHKDTKVVCISRDLPFAQQRFCGAEGLEDVITASDMRTKDFGEKYGLEIAEGPLKGLLARAVVVIGKDGQVEDVQLVPEIAEEPDYEAVLSRL